MFWVGRYFDQNTSTRFHRNGNHDYSFSYSCCRCCCAFCFTRPRGQKADYGVNIGISPFGGSISLGYHHTKKTTFKLPSEDPQRLMPRLS